MLMLSCRRNLDAYKACCPVRYQRTRARPPFHGLPCAGGTPAWLCRRSFRATAGVRIHRTRFANNTGANARHAARSKVAVARRSASNLRRPHGRSQLPSVASPFTLPSFSLLLSLPFSLPLPPPLAAGSPVAGGTQGDVHELRPIYFMAFRYEATAPSSRSEAPHCSRWQGSRAGSSREATSQLPPSRATWCSPFGSCTI